ncbi:MAG: ArsA family ATPase [Cyanobacteria bacterium J06642_2]
MSRILTFLGQGGTGLSTVAIAVAKAAAQTGRRTLLVGHQDGASVADILGVTAPTEPEAIAANLSLVELRATALLEKGWSMVKDLEAQYVKTPFFKEIYGQELAVLPGMDSALALEALRQYDASKDYDSIVYLGAGTIETLRMFGLPEVSSWYRRRASKAFLGSDLFNALRPFAEPILRSVTNIDRPIDDLVQDMGGAKDVLEEGRTAVANRDRVLAYLVTTTDPLAQKTARFLWGSAQMVGLTVGGVAVNPGGSGAVASADFAPLVVRELPALQGSDWSPMVDAVTPFLNVPDVPAPVAIDESARTVTLFVPGFDKSQIELSQSGPEITVTAGDQRRNVALPSSMAGSQAKGAKFQDMYLIISF